MSGAPRVLVDGRVMSHPTAGGRGIGRYTVGLVRSLVGAGADVVVLNDSREDERRWREAIRNLACAPMSRQGFLGENPSTWFMCTQMMLHPVSLDVVPEAVTQAGLRVVGVLHDVIPQRYPDRYLVDPNARTQAVMRAQMVRTFDLLVANSTFSADTASAVLNFMRERIHVVGAAIEPQFQPSDGADIARRLTRLNDLGLDPNRDRVVAVTGADDRKNTPGLLRAWARLTPELRRSHQLVVTCAITPAVRDRWHHITHHLGLSWGHDVVATDVVTDDEMVALLQGAKLSVFPSLEEGFGLPVAEAAACGCPVVCSDNSSLPEVIGDPTATFDAHDVADMASVITSGLIDAGFRDRLRGIAADVVRRCTWDNVGRRAYDALASAPRKSRSRPMRRFALVGPFAGSPSGIGAYNERLLSAWASKETLLEPVVDLTGTNLCASGRHNAAGLGRFIHRHDFDAILNVLGSSPYHAATVATLKEDAGHVWLHEPSLVGCHVGIGHLSGTREWADERMRAELKRCGVAADRWPTDLLDAEAYHRAGVTFLEPVLDAARSVIVSSDDAAEVVRSIRADHAPILVMPLATHHNDRATMADGRTVVSYGWVDESKKPEVVIGAIATLSGWMRDIRLVFAGGCSDVYRAHLEEVVCSRHLEEWVSFTGWLSDAELNATLLSARVGVQLRRNARGQRSAAVAEFHSRGIPVISDIGSDEINDADELAEILRPLLTSDTAWSEASDASWQAGQEFLFDDLAVVLERWVDESSRRPRGSIAHVDEFIAGSTRHTSLS